MDTASLFSSFCYNFQLRTFGGKPTLSSHHFDCFSWATAGWTVPLVQNNSVILQEAEMSFLIHTEKLSKRYRAGLAHVEQNESITGFQRAAQGLTCLRT